MTCCEYCKNHGITCVPRWGPKKEESLQLAKQLPTPDDAVINEIDGRKLHFLRSGWVPNSPHLSFLQKLMAFYGPSVRSLPLRSAILATFDVDDNLRNQCTFEDRPGAHLIYATSVLAKKKSSSLEEEDM